MIIRKTMIWFMLLLLISAAAFLFVKTDLTEAGNETSRMTVVQSLVDHGTFDITNSIFKTPDKAMLNGKWYGDKPPLLTWLTAGEYWILAHGFGWTFKQNYPLVIFLLNLPYFLISCGVGFLTYIGLTRLIGQTASLYWRITASVLSVISTLVFSYSVTIGNHTVCAFLLMLLLLQLQTAEKTEWPLFKTFFCGITAGLIFNCEFVLGSAFGTGVFLLILTAAAPDWKKRWQRIAAYAAGAFLLLACEGAMNAAAYGSPLPLYLLTHKPDLAHKDYLCYAWNVLFGFEGFFIYMPACLFLFPALFKKFPGRDRVCQCMLLSLLLTALLFLAGTSDYGGFCYGYRFLIPAAPVMLFYTFLSFHTRRRKGLCDLLFLLALIWGIITSYFGTFNPWNSGYEGSLTQPGNFNEKVRNGFLGNVFVFCFESAPDSPVTGYFVKEFYGPETAYRYLCEEFLIRRRPEMIPVVNQWFNQNQGFGKP